MWRSASHGGFPTRTSELLVQGQRIGRKLRADGGGAVEPRQEGFRLSVIDSEAAQLDQFGVAPLVGAPLEPIGRDADEAALGGALALREIAGKLLLGVAELAIQVRLHLEGGAPHDSVDAALRLRHTLLEVHEVALGTEPIHQQFLDRRLDLVVARLGGKLPDDLGEAVVAQSPMPRL